MLGVRGNWLGSHRQPLDPLCRQEIKDRILIPAIVFPPILELPTFFFFTLSLILFSSFQFLH